MKLFDAAAKHDTEAKFQEPGAGLLAIVHRHHLIAMIKALVGLDALNKVENCPMTINGADVEWCPLCSRKVLHCFEEPSACWIAWADNEADTMAESEWNDDPVSELDSNDDNEGGDNEQRQTND
jgi:hypothetical protein